MPSYDCCEMIYLTLHPTSATTYSNEGDQMCPTQGRLNQFQWGGSRSPVTGTVRPPIPPSNTTLDVVANVQAHSEADIYYKNFY